MRRTPAPHPPSLSPTLSGPRGRLCGLSLSVVLSYLTNLQQTEGIWLLTPLTESQSSECVLNCCKVLCRSMS